MLPSTLDMVPSPSTWNPRPSTLDKKIDSFLARTSCPIGLVLLHRVGINKNACILLITLLFPRHCDCQTQAFLGSVGHGLFVHSPGCDRVLLSTSRGGQIGKAVAFGRSDLTVSYLYRQSLSLRSNYT